MMMVDVCLQPGRLSHLKGTMIVEHCGQTYMHISKI